MSGVTVSYVSVLEADLDLSNEANLFNAMSFAVSLIIRFSNSVCDTFCWSVFKLPIRYLTVYYFGWINRLLKDMIFCLDLF